MKVSIVTPSYNQLAYLKLCAASVADQTDVEVEHIIQDAGTAGNLESWAKLQPNLRLFVETDRGMYDAINRGLKRVQGEICGYLNCDEQYLPETLAKVVEFFVAHPEVDVLFGDVVVVDKNGHPLSYRRTVLPTKRHVQLAHLNTPTCATFFRRKLLELGFYFDPRWKAIGDAVWMESLLQAKVKMATLSEPLAVFTLTGKNLGTTTLSAFEAADREHTMNENGAWRILTVLKHRLKKAFAGAYRPRRVQIDIFTFSSPDKRQRFVENNVGFSWPTQSEATRL